MTVPAASIDRLYEWLPAHHRVRDAERGYPLRALLRAIGEEVDVVEDDITQLYADWFIETCPDWAVPYIGELVGWRPVPEAGVAGDPATGAGQRLNAWLAPRREVANTVALRRRKGALHVLEHLARDVAGWPALATEYYRTLGWTQNLAHLHTERARTARITDMPRPGDGACNCDPRGYTVDVRRIDSRRTRGLRNIPNIGLAVYRLKAYTVTATPACCIEDIGAHCYTFSVFGNDAPLFATAPPCGPCAHENDGVPLPLTRARMQRVLSAHPPVARVDEHYYGAGRSVAIYAPGWPTKHAPQPIPASAIVVADLSDWAYVAPRGTVAVDPERGRIAFPPAQAPRHGVRVDWRYGFPADMGGGEYARALVEPTLRDASAFDRYDFIDAAAVLERLQHRGSDGEPLSTYLVGRFGSALKERIDAWKPGTTPDDALVADLAHAFDGELADAGLYQPARFPGIELTDEMIRLRAAGGGDSLARFNRLLFEAVYGDAIAVRQRRYAVGRKGYERIADALAQWRKDAPRHAVIEFTHSGVWTEPVNIRLHARQTLQLRAAERVRPVLRLLDYMADRADAFRVAGDAGSRLVLDGLIVVGRGIQVRRPDECGEGEGDDLCELVVRHSTLVPGWDLGCDCEPKRPNEPSIEVAGSGAALTIEHSIIGAIELAHETPRASPNTISIADSIVDATRSGRVALHGGEGRPAWANLTIVRTTVFGALTTHAIVLAENCIFTGCVEVARRQTGCMRFCYAPIDSRTPRRFRCQPDLARAAALAALAATADDDARKAALAAATLRVKPRFTSTRYGHPAYAQLALDVAPEIARGADDESEMGAYHDLFAPQRLANLRARLDEYTPAGMESGITFAT